MGDIINLFSIENQSSEYSYAAANECTHQQIIQITNFLIYLISKYASSEETGGSMAEKELLEFYVLMEVEKYKRKYQWWMLSGACVIIYGLFVLFLSINSSGYYSLVFLIYVMPPLLTGAIIFFQGTRMQKTHKEMLFMLEKMKNPDTTLEEFPHY